MIQATADPTGSHSPIRSPYLRWGLVALIQLALISVPLVERLGVQMRGQKLMLALDPVDPRDLLRGDYVILNLSVNTLPRTLPGADATFAKGDTVYVSLSVDADGVARESAVSKDLAAAKQPVLRATVAYTSETEIRIDTGMDAFFLEEGKGKEIEVLPAERVQLVAAVSNDGRAVPLRLLVDGKPFLSDAAF